MEYQVLARKWRPKNFHQMVGQEHVLRALINALDQDRVHHAYLFTGTRGVGKTTIARIFAKCLNCEIGVTSKPCGTCGSCVEVDEGRFIDLIEVDAASRTRVEDTRELLENVQYAPTRGRYKVYLIDEVHMLSTHSFNALLKTLEEPPPHVKFLLATTDPQKLPVTILSRCLQFSLKALSARRISEYLQYLMGEEAISFEENALADLARAANGSMRDALSLTDQAIAFGGENGIMSSDVQTLLGSIDRGLVFVLLKNLIEENGQGLLQTANQMLDQGAESSEVLAELIEVLHAISVAQIVPEAIDNNQVDKEKVIQLAAEMQFDDVQLYYQIALMGRKDLPLVPNPRSGLEMVLLRMLSFKPQGAETPASPRPGVQINSPPIGPNPRDSGANSSTAKPSAPAPIQTPNRTQTPSAAQAPNSNLVQVSAQAAVPPQEASPAQASVQGRMPAINPTTNNVHGVASQSPTQAMQINSSVDNGPVVSPIDGKSTNKPISNQINQLKSLINSGSSSQGQAQRQNTAVSIEPELQGELHHPDLSAEYSEYAQSADSQNASPQRRGPQSSDPRGANSQSTIPQSTDPYSAGPQSTDPKSTLAQAAISSGNDSLETQPQGTVLPFRAPNARPPVPRLEASTLGSLDWADIIDQLGIDGAALNFARNVAMESRNDGAWHFKLKPNHEALYREPHVKAIEAALQTISEQPLSVQVGIGTTDIPTPAEQRLAERQAKLEAAERNLYADPLVNQLISQFGAQIDKNSIEPIE